MRELAVETFAQVGCEGLARVDFFVDGESVLVNELNTMPGFTPTSVYAKLMSAYGVAYAGAARSLCRWGSNAIRSGGRGGIARGAHLG